MSQEVVIDGVMLRGDDLNFPQSPWRRVNRGGSLRLLPIALGAFGSAIAISFAIDPTVVELIAIMGPMVAGIYGYLWVTNTAYFGAYKKAYSQTPLGSEPCTFVFDTNGLRQVMPCGESSFRWSAFGDVAESVAGFRFWMTPFMAVFIPARFIEEAKAVELRRLIDAARERGDIKGAPQ